MTIALLVASLVVAACTSPAPRRSVRPTLTPAPTTTTISELRTALATWHRTRATIIYRTERQRPGMPVSVHQCLRAMLDDDRELQEVLKECDPSGVVTLVWDPPRRWRIDVAEAGTTTIAIVIGHAGVTCERPDGGPASCRSRAADAILGHLPFHELILGVGRALRGVGLSPEAPVTMTPGFVAGIPVRCYERRSGSSSAQWCFALDGALLSLELRTDGRGPTFVEAVRVSDRVDDERFDPPAP